MDTFKPEKQEACPTIQSIRKLQTEINISNDDLRDVLMMFMFKLNQKDLIYALLTLETELQRRLYGFHENEAA